MHFLRERKNDADRNERRPIRGFSDYLLPSFAPKSCTVSIAKYVPGIVFFREFQEIDNF
jgi:hypothetical protein